MKDRIIEILINSLNENMQGKTLRHWIETDGSDAVIKFIDAEVEKRIAERMPNPSDKIKALREYQFKLRGRHEKNYITEDFLEGVEWLRSRLTKPGAESSQKTEGGGE